MTYNKNIQKKSELAKSGSSCLIGLLMFLAIIFSFYYWPISVLLFSIAIYWSFKSSKEIKDYEESGEILIERNHNLLDTKKIAHGTKPFGVVVDVETTGLLVDDTTPTIKKIKENPEWYPKIVQIAWFTITRKYEIVEKHFYFIKQTEPIPERAIEIHGITTEVCNDIGKDIKEILYLFSESIINCEYYIGHNVKFDKYVIEAECIKNDIPKPFKYMKKYDTMQMGKKIAKRRFFKLEELAIMIFGKKMLEKHDINFHDAYSDVWVTASIFSLLHRNNIKY